MSTAARREEVSGGEKERSEVERDILCIELYLRGFDYRL